MTALARTIEIASPIGGGTEVRLTFAVSALGSAASARRTGVPSAEPDEEAAAVSLSIFVALAVFASALVLGLFAVDPLRHDPGTFVAIAVMLALAVILDLLWKCARSGRPQRRREAGPV